MCKMQKLVFSSNSNVFIMIILSGMALGSQIELNAIPELHLIRERERERDRGLVFTMIRFYAGTAVQYADGDLNSRHPVQYQS